MMAFMQWRIGQAVPWMNQLNDELRHVRKMSKEEQARLETWRKRYLGWPDNFEEEWMDGEAFGLDD